MCPCVFLCFFLGLCCVAEVLFDGFLLAFLLSAWLCNALREKLQKGLVLGWIGDLHVRLRR
jgi:hypothetical protein